MTLTARYEKLLTLVEKSADPRKDPIWDTADVSAGDLGDVGRFNTPGQNVYTLDVEEVRYRPRSSLGVDRAYDSLQVELEGGGKAVIRASVVDFLARQVVYDEWFIPPGPVKDFLTAVSGATQAIIDAEAKHTVEDLIGWMESHAGRDTIFAAHGYKNDFRALRLKPPRNVLDTARLFDHPGLADNESSLAGLVVHYLGVDMDRAIGHSSSDDALACADLLSYLIEEGEFRGGRGEKSSDHAAAQARMQER